MLKNDMLKPENYDRTDAELEEFLVHCIFVAGKKSKMMSEKLEKFLKIIGNPKSLFEHIAKMDYYDIYFALVEAQTGQYSRLANCLYELSRKKLDLRLCNCEELESIHGIGKKTSRFFICYSRKNSKYAILDTHILRWLRQNNVDAPKSTPSSHKKYTELEDIFLNYANNMNLTPAELDFKIWLAHQKSYAL